MSDFHKIIPHSVLKLFKQLTQKGIEVAIVGGTVRDHFLGLPFKGDIDCELRFKKTLPIELEQLLLPLGFEKLSYSVFKLDQGDFSIEMTLPRVERFIEGQYSHSNFDVTFDSELDFMQATKRRDFTINALAMVWRDGFELVDPLGGLEHLKQKKLVPCSKQFVKDPVRFARAARFEVLLGFEFENNFNIPFSINQIGHFYIKKEALKARRPMCFVKHLFEIFNIEIEDEIFSNYCQQEKPTDELNLGGFFFFSPLVKEKLNILFAKKIALHFFKLPICFHEMSSVEELSREDRLLFLKEMEKLNSAQFNFLEGEGLIDLSTDDYRRLKGFKCDLSVVPAQEREAFKWLRALGSLRN